MEYPSFGLRPVYLCRIYTELTSDPGLKQKLILREITFRLNVKSYLQMGNN